VPRSLTSGVRQGGLRARLALPPWTLSQRSTVTPAVCLGPGGRPHLNEGEVTGPDGKKLALAPQLLRTETVSPEGGILLAQGGSPG
jgi:hypothetical protein